METPGGTIETPIRVAAFSLGGLLIFLMFSATLVVAMSQQKIAANIASKTSLTYDEAYAIFAEKGDLEARKIVVEGELEDLNKQFAAEGKKLDDLTINTEPLVELIRNIANSGAHLRVCPDNFIVRPEDAKYGPDWRDVAIGLDRCKLSDAQFLSLGITPDELDKVVEYETSAYKLKKAGEALNSQIDTEQIKLNEVSEALKEVASVERAFTPQERLKRYGLTGIFELPPIILPMILTFASGLFGSLLINLILIVYPDNHNKKFSIYKGQLFVQHVILGGLIAVAVYVVIGAGASVLAISGSSPSPDNFLTFSAIGLFAGMFSDRAASWLEQNIPFNDPDEGGQTPKPNPARASQADLATSAARRKPSSRSPLQSQAG